MFQTCFPPEIFYATKAKESFPTRTRMINRFFSVEVSTRGYLVCVYSVNVSDQNVISKKKCRIVLTFTGNIFYLKNVDTVK